MKIYTIYKSTNLINGKIYIGFDSNWPKRIKQHKTAKYKTKFYYALQKHGFENFVWEPIFQSLDHEHTLTVMEAYFISEYDSFENGYNSTYGGQGASAGLSKTKEHRKNIAAALTGKAKSKSHIQKMSIANIGLHGGEKNHFYGKKHSDETKAIIKIKRADQVTTKETKKRMQETHEKRYHEDANHPLKIYKEDLLRRNLLVYKEILALTDNGLSYRDIAIKCNVSESTVFKVRKNRTKIELYLAQQFDVAA